MSLLRPLRPARARRLGAVGVAAVLLLASCSGDDQDAGPPTTTTSVPELELTVTRAEHVTDAAAVAELADPVRGEVVEVVTTFLHALSVEALATGEPAHDRALEQLTDDAAAEVDDGDLAALVDTGSAAADEVEIELAEVELSALGAGEGVDLVVARFELVVHGRGLPDEDGAEVEVRRTGELTLVPVEGEWRISAYDVRVARTTPEDETATTTTTEAES